jgi:hypothetical protein
MMGERRTIFHARFDGVEAMLFAVAFIVGVIGSGALLRRAGVATQSCAAGLGLGFASVSVLRLVRPTRAAAGGSNKGTRRSFLSLLLLGVGWFVLVVAALLAFLVVAMLSDVGADAAPVLLLPVVPLLVGGGIVYAGLRVGRTASSTRT